MLKIVVVTRVPDPEEGSGNLAVETDARFESALPSAANGWRGRTISSVDALGLGAINLRTPVFDLGEIMVMEGDRDALGRDPGRWDVDVEEFDDLAAAWARSRAVQDA